MRTALLLALCLAATGCWKEIHEAAAPRHVDAPVVAGGRSPPVGGSPGNL